MMKDDDDSHNYDGKGSKTQDDDNKNLQQSMFVEICRPINEDEILPRTIDAFAIEIEPKQCSQIVKQLSKELPLPPRFQHLKRVRKPTTNNHKPDALGGDSSPSSPPTKKRKLLLQVLIGGEDETVAAATILAESNNNETPPSFHKVVVPGRPPETKEESLEFNNELWPTHFFPLKTETHKQQELALTDPVEVEKMQQFIEESITTQTVLIVDPSAQSIVSRSNDESEMQNITTAENPLATPILLALQGVSRKERDAALQKSLTDFSKGQYLCTGYDLYTYEEPTIYEAMSCVHSRLRRVIFFDAADNNDCSGEDKQVWRNGCSRHYIHCLPGTNHKFRSFQYQRPGRSGQPNAKNVNR